MSKDIETKERRWTSIMLSTETRDALKDLKKKDFGAEESWDHLIRRLAGLPNGLGSGVSA